MHLASRPAEKTRSMPVDEAGAAKYCLTIFASADHLDSLASVPLARPQASPPHSSPARGCGPRFPNPHWRPLHQKVAPTCGAHFTYRWRPLHLHVSREELMDDFLVALHVVRPPGYATRPRE